MNFLSYRTNFSYYLVCKSPQYTSYLLSSQLAFQFIRTSFFSIFSSGGYLFHLNRTILSALVMSYLGNIPVKFDWSGGWGGGGEIGVVISSTVHAA